MTPLSPGRYRHFKGRDYEVVAIARHSETLEAMVIYRPVDDEASWWVRPLSMFTEKVERGDYSGPRFTFVGPMIRA